MIVSKHLHSCLLVKELQTTVLIDPGIYTYQENALTTDSIAKLDYILITHEHPDHMSLPFIQELIEKFPQVQIISNPSVSEILREKHIRVHTDLSSLPADLRIQFEEVGHEKLWDKATPQNIVFQVFNKLTHPGDSHHFETATDVLALPIQAPWGNTREAVELALRLKPKEIIPIHDWMLKDEVRKALYIRLEDFFTKNQIIFHPLETGNAIEI